MSTSTVRAARGSSSGLGLLERWFRLTERRTTAKTEALGGLTTFLTMVYIVFVNPAILSAAGMPFAAVAVSTAIVAALMCIIMGLYANVPFALASGLGINAVVAFTIILGFKVPWAVGMSCIFIEGLVAVVLVLAGFREAVVRAVPHSMKLSIGVGIGLFITFIGLRDGGLVVNNDATGVGLGDFTTGPALITLAGIGVGLFAATRGAKFAVLAAIVASTVLGLVFGVLDGPSGVFQVPGSSDFSTIGDGLAPDNLLDALTWALVPTIFALFITDFFDTVGTAVALGKGANLTNERGELPGMNRVLLVDSAAASVGGAFGVSSATTYVESGTGIAAGARTGLASVVTGLLFAATVFFSPLMELVGQSVGKAGLHPATAAALVLVGLLMMELAKHIEWSTPEAGVPAFLIIAGIPLTFSISGGIGLGIFGYVLVMLAQKRAREIHPLMWVMLIMFGVFFAQNWLTAHIA